MTSIIVPNYNHAEFLHRRINSILAQSCQDFELILLDDCSTDNSVAVLNEYTTNPHVSHIVVNETNSGSPFKQWQRGFDLAKGDYICVAESDDWWEPTLLEKLISGMQDGVVLSVCQSNLVDEQMRVTYTTKMVPDQGIVNGREFVLHNLAGDTMVVNAGMCMFRKQDLNKIEPLYLDYQGAGDWMFWLEIALLDMVAICNEALNQCYRHSGTVTSYSLSSGRDMREGNRICQYAIRRIQPTGRELWSILKQRYHIYQQQKHLYASSAIQKEAKRSLLHVHAWMPWVYAYKSLRK